MSVAYFIVIKPEIEGFDPFVNGKAIAKVNEKALTRIIQRPRLFTTETQRHREEENR